MFSLELFETNFFLFFSKNAPVVIITNEYIDRKFIDSGNLRMTSSGYLPLESTNLFTGFINYFEIDWIIIEENP